MDKLEIRLANQGDLNRIEEIVTMSYAKYVPIMGQKPAPMTADYGQIIEAGQIFVGIIENELVAMVVLKDFADYVLIGSLAVAPGFQGRGLGKAMLNFAEQYARNRAKSQTRLYTNVLMEANIVIYQKVGYHIYDRRDEDGFSRVYFLKNLD